MKILLQIIFIGCFFFPGVWSQDYPFYEDLAFNFYQNEILKKYPVEEKISVYEFYYKFHGEGIYFEFPACLDNLPAEAAKAIKPFDREKYGQGQNGSEKVRLNFKDLDQNQFKIRKRGWGNFPRLFISYPRILNDRIFVNITEDYKLHQKEYSLEMDLEGNVLQYCRSRYDKVILY